MAAERMSYHVHGVYVLFSLEASRMLQNEVNTTLL